MTQKTKKKKSKKKTSVCLKCPAHCCRDLVIVISKPRTRAEIEELKWHVHFDTVRVAVRNNRWHLVVKGKCIYLNRNNLCTIYERRPKKCRDHMPPDCEKYGKWYDLFLSTPDELEDYLKNDKKRKSLR
jgi:Fe-S-cluster containining protein